MNKEYLKKEINKINNERLPNTNRTERLIDLFEKYHKELQTTTKKIDCDCNAKLDPTYRWRNFDNDE